MKLNWVVKLRWIAVIAQLSVLIFAKFLLGITLDPLPPLGLIAVVAVSNFFLPSLDPSYEEPIIGGTLLFDIIVLSGLLYFSGGITNPFSLFYLVHITLAAILLNPIWTWLAAIESIVLYGLLLVYYVPIPELSMHGSRGTFSLHLQGMWLAFVLGAALLAYFLTRLVADIRRKDSELKRFEVLKLNQERLASITTLAASAAHELATPLSTIAISAEEILARNGAADSASEDFQDASIIAAQVARCRDVLESLALKVGDPRGEMPERIKLAEVISEMSAELTTVQRKLLAVELPSPEMEIIAPRRGLRHVLVSLVRNALDARIEDLVRLKVNLTEKEICFCISDDGKGLDSRALERLGEPFFTTKSSGMGMGLGVFIAKLFAERLGGSLFYKRRGSRGTDCILSFPFSLPA